MKTISDLNDLREFGIRFLTGEACRASRRILCDLTPAGARVVRDLLGLPGNIQFSENWNGGATGSFMLPRGLYVDLAIWCLIHAGCPEIVESDEEVVGRESGDTDEEWQGFVDHMRKYHRSTRVISLKDGQPGVGTRCTHAMSGRTE